jgi:hypothetical protein
LSVSKYTFPLLDSVLTLKLLLPPETAGNSKGPEAFALKISNFGIHFWPRVTQIKLLKRGIGGYLIWSFLHIQPPCGGNQSNS